MSKGAGPVAVDIGSVGEVVRIDPEIVVLPNLGFDAMLEAAAGLGIECLEFACGNWSSAPHIELDRMLESSAARRENASSCTRSVGRMAGGFTRPWWDCRCWSSSRSRHSA